MFSTECFRHEFMKPCLEFQAVVRLDEVGSNGKKRHEMLECHKRILLIKKWKNHPLLVTGEDIHDGMEIDGMGKAGKLRRDVFDVHLELAGYEGVFDVHMACFLNLRPTMVDLFMYPSPSLEEAMDGNTVSGNFERIFQLARFEAGAVAKIRNIFLNAGSENPASAAVGTSGFVLKISQLTPLIFFGSLPPIDHRSRTHPEKPSRFPNLFFISPQCSYDFRW